MSLFDKLRKKKNDIDSLAKNNEVKSEEVFTANVKFYNTPTGELFGMFTLTETVITALPLNPKEKFMVDNKEVTEWKLGLFSITENKVLGMVEYYKALEKLKNYSIGEKDGYLITTALTLSEQKELLK